FLLLSSWRPNSCPPTAPLQTRHDRAARDPAIPAVDRPPHAQTPLLAPRARDLPRRPALLGRGEPPLAEPGNPGLAGGRRGLSRPPVRGYESVRHPRQTRHHYAKGHTVSKEN